MKPEGDLFHCLAPKAKGLHPKLILDQVLHLAREVARLFGDAFALFGFRHEKGNGTDGDRREQDAVNAIHVVLFSAEHLFSPSAFCSYFASKRDSLCIVCNFALTSF